jgi:hypothetical protein
VKLAELLFVELADEQDPEVLFVWMELGLARLSFC